MKKLKLLFSISTLCFALAVLCFGVLAATSVSYNLGGSISYVVNDVFATVETDVYTSSFNNSTNLKTEAEKFLTSDTVENATQTEYKYDFTTTGAESESYSNTIKTDGNTEGGIQITYNTTDKRTYFIVVSVTNNGDNIISAQSNTLDLKSANTKTQSINRIPSLSKGETGKIVFALMLDDITKSIDKAGASFGYVITLQNGEISSPVATFSYLNINNDNEFSVDETKTQVLTEQIFTVPNFEIDDEHYDATSELYLYNFKLSDIDTLKFNNVQIMFSTSHPFMIGIAPKCYASYQDLGIDLNNGSIKVAMGESTASAYYDLNKVTTFNFCIIIGTNGKAESTSGYNLEISISKSFTEGEFRYFATNNDTEWVVGPKDETISGNNGEITIPKTFQDKPVVGLQTGLGLFSKCSNIKKVIIQDNITEIPIGCFAESGIQEIVLGSEIELIGAMAFSHCSSLTSINIPEGVTSIGYEAFSHCSSLTSITIPEGVTSIGEFTFDFCSSLTSINIPEGVTSIGSGAFDGCSNLTSIEIPISVTSIGTQAFYECSGLTRIHFSGTKAEWNAISKSGSWIPSGVNVECKDGTIVTA